MNIFIKWKMHWADYFSWLRDENWHKQKLEEARTRYPWIRASRSKLTEIHVFDEPFLGRIYEAIFRDESSGYLIEIFRPDQPRSVLEEQGYSDMLEGHGRPGFEVYNSLEEARAALPNLLQQARAEWSNTVTFIDKDGKEQTWLGFLPASTLTSKRGDADTADSDRV